MINHEAAIPGWNLALRLFLELASFAAFGWAGWELAGGGIVGVLLAVVLPVAAMAAWGTFAVVGDPSRSGKAPVPVPGWLRLVVEYAVFGGACVLLAAAGAVVLAVVLAALNVLHLAFAIPRTRWLLRQG
ncbi:YrdB family protein [Yinghuangia seranimata]|uniref:YrdB family protein n=1 Tax=Yinghuangia seranimata TaxID=408067 RepID=UPI00248C274D|nr:YrdB family protein [Yinghuangia seranimata]MDI2124889.1 YrdB family protein [Yinghuangia seranimata]